MTLMIPKYGDFFLILVSYRKRTDFISFVNNPPMQMFEKFENGRSLFWF